MEKPRRIWNKIPDKIETAIVNLALEEPDLSPRELAVNFTDTKGSFVSEATVYRLLKDHGLITSPASRLGPTGEASSGQSGGRFRMIARQPSILPLRQWLPLGRWWKSRRAA